MAQELVIEGKRLSLGTRPGHRWQGTEENGKVRNEEEANRREEERTRREEERGRREDERIREAFKSNFWKNLGFRPN